MAKDREQNNSLIDFNDPKLQTNIDQTTDTDKVAFSKLQIRQSDPKEELIEVTKSLIPPPHVTETLREVMGNSNGEELSEAGKRLQKEEEKYNLYKRISIGQLSKKEESDMDTDDLTYTYFG